MRRFVLCLLLLMLSGCVSALSKSEDGGGQTLSLGDAYLPLEDVRERSGALDVVIRSDTAITTIGKHSYVKSLDEFLTRKPIGSRQFRAVMLHEQAHARRQLRSGPNAWIFAYGVDKDFALYEEQIGYYYEIRHLVTTGYPVSAEGYARALASYQILSGSLISYDDALIWVRDVIAGRWAPPVD